MKNRVIGRNRNVIKIGKPDSWLKHMTYTDLLAERRYIRSEKKRWLKVQSQLYNCDPRGMWGPEIKKLDKNLVEFLESCDFVEVEVQKEMIKRIKDGN